MEEWKEYKLGKIAEFRTGKLNSNAAVKNGKYPFFTCAPETYYINDYAFDQKAILLAGNNAEGNFNIKYYEGKFNAYQRTYVINPISKDVNIHYLFYALQLCLQQFKTLSQGTSTKFLTAKILNDFCISVPSSKSQETIVKIIKSLDDKIEVNRRINDNLEQQAQALFKSWFVDFEPYKDGEFVESELGMIPKGWTIEKVEDLTIKMASGGTPKSLNQDYYSGDIRWFSTKELKDCYLFDSEKHISEDALNNSSAKLFPANTVLMAIYASPTVGRLGILTNESSFNQAAVGLVPKNNIGKEFIFLSLLSERDNLNNLASGAAQQNLNVGIVKNYRIIVPTQTILDNFNNIVCNIFESIRLRTEQMHHLSSIRDTLLPKLMFGELRVPDTDLINEMLEKGIR